jgi:hypothetical protein
LPDAVRPGFAVQESTGTYLRDEPVPEDPSKALVGVVYALPTPSIPQSVEVEWSNLPPGLAEVRARVIDPEISREFRIAAGAPRLRWQNELREDPLPRVAAIRVRRQPTPVPLLSLGLLAAGLVLARRFGSVFLRLGVALALLALPILALDVDLGGQAAPSAREARAITSALLDNLYRALNFREEEAVYDRLALSLTEAPRTAAYTANRRALAFARVGGARTHVDVVEMLDLKEIRARPDGGFEATARWTVAGSVTHFGHRHLRRNLYTARLGVLPSGGTWKIDVFDVGDVARQR